MTGPMMRTTFPLFMLPRSLVLATSLQRGGACDNLQNLLGDPSLTDLIHVQSEVINQVGSVAGSRVHGGHSRAVFGRRRLQECPEDLHFHMLGKELLEDLRLGRLVEISHRQ